MLATELETYLNEHILLKNEELLKIDAKEQDGIINLSIIKRTARTRRIVARVTIGPMMSITDDDLVPTKRLKELKTPYTKKHFPMSEEVNNWIRKGLVIREIRLEKDERTVKSEQYRMGYVLYQLQKLHKQKQEDQTRELISTWKKRWLEVKQQEQNLDEKRRELIFLLTEQIEMISSDAEAFLDGKRSHLLSIPESWRLPKEVLFMHFLVAIYKIALCERHFDWKQIGANYFREIGGSKKFDRYKKEFIEQTEQLLHRPIQLFGLTSLGTITPIFFSGPMRGENVSYDDGSVHATTDLTVFTNYFETNADVLWLVENRAILIRMAYEEGFLKETNSIVVAVDGQVRSGHRELIRQLATSVKQVIIWTDVDEAGLTIAKELSTCVEGADVIKKWVVPPLEVVTEIKQLEQLYEQTMIKAREEQEQEVGGVNYWSKWINH